MRKDMGKVITERPRSGSWLATEKFGKSIHWRGWDEDYAEPKHESGSPGRVYGSERKNPTDVLGPLKGWIRKQVGRPWNKVYSEICDVLDKRKLTHKHVLDHLFQWVCRHAVLCPDGIWREPDSVSYRWGWAPDFFVHPKNGLLLKNKVKKEIEKKKPVEELKLSDGTEYRLIKGIWYHCSIKLLPKREWIYSPMGRLVTNTVVSKRQLGKKELKEVRKLMS